MNQKMPFAVVSEHHQSGLSLIFLGKDFQGTSVWECSLSQHKQCSRSSPAYHLYGAGSLKIQTLHIMRLNESQDDTLLQGPLLEYQLFKFLFSLELAGGTCTQLLIQVSWTLVEMKCQHGCRCLGHDSERAVVNHISSNMIHIRHDRWILQEMKMLCLLSWKILLLFLSIALVCVFFFRWSTSGRDLTYLYIWLMA